MNSKKSLISANLIQSLFYLPKVRKTKSSEYFLKINLIISITNGKNLEAILFYFFSNKIRSISAPKRILLLQLNQTMIILFLGIHFVIL